MLKIFSMVLSGADSTTVSREEEDQCERSIKKIKMAKGEETDQIMEIAHDHERWREYRCERE